jgi:hypothetical protein
MSAPVNRADLPEWQAAQPDDPDDYDKPTVWDYDEGKNDGYALGYSDGYNAASRQITLHYLLTSKIPYRVRAKYYALRRRVFPHNNDIPF